MITEEKTKYSDHQYNYNNRSNNKFSLSLFGGYGLSKFVALSEAGKYRKYLPLGANFYYSFGNNIFSGISLGLESKTKLIVADFILLVALPIPAKIKLCQPATLPA